MASTTPIVPTPVIAATNIPDLPCATPTGLAVKPRALIVVGDGSEEMEALTLSDLLTLGGMHVTLAALGRKPMNVVEGNFGLRIKADQSIEDCSFGTFDLIVLPGVRLVNRMNGDWILTHLPGCECLGCGSRALSGVRAAQEDAAVAHAGRTLGGRELECSSASAAPAEPARE